MGHTGVKLMILLNFLLIIWTYKYVLGYNRSSYNYELYGISNHGGGSGGGHYWAYCKNNDGKWYKYNDNIVSNLTLERVVSPEAYCLFYKLKN